MHHPQGGTHVLKSECCVLTFCEGAANLQHVHASESHPYHWLKYEEAAAYCGWSIAYLRNMVSAGQIPVYGAPRRRRFRQDVLDAFLSDPDAAMRRFRSERNQHGS